MGKPWEKPWENGGKCVVFHGALMGLDGTYPPVKAYSYGKIQHFAAGKTRYVDWAIFNGYMKCQEGTRWCPPSYKLVYKCL